jgi:Acyl-CoA reductase (LuxC)
MPILNVQDFESLDESNYPSFGLCKTLTDQDTLNFCAEISRAILSSPEAKNYPDLVTVGFFCRKANSKKALGRVGGLENRIGWGTAVHIAPSNIPMNFAFSFFISLLAGNTNVVRIPSKEFPQVELFLKIFEEVCSAKQFEEIFQHNWFIRTERDSKTLDQFISDSDLMIVWGGDDTVAHFRKKKRKAKAIEVNFPNRISSALLGSDAYLVLDQHARKKLANDFYNDTYLVDQNACSSPSKVFWLGNETSNDSAQKLFWQELKDFIGDSYSLHPTSQIDKIMDMMRVNQESGEAICQVDMKENVWVLPIVGDLDHPELLKGRFGLFFQKYISSLDQLPAFMSPIEQTLGIFGVSNDETKNVLMKTRISGVDRIVPIGKALDMSFVWDGRCLLSTLSRMIDLN